jgi:hypothetical protein
VCRASAVHEEVSSNEDGGRMKPKRKQDTATMTAAEREALEVTEIRTQFGPLFDLYYGLIETAFESSEDGGDALNFLPDNSHEPLHAVLLVRQRLKLLTAEEKAILKALADAGQ